MENNESPEDKTGMLEKQVKALQEQNADLLQRLTELEKRFDLMIFAKLDDPTQPFSNLLLRYFFPIAVRNRLRAALGVMTCRVVGVPVDYFGDRSALVSPELLAQEGPPTKEEILHALEFATEIPDEERLLQFVEAIGREGIFPAFGKYAMELFGLSK